MANISSINLPDGSSYNFKDSVSGYISNTGVYGIYYGACSTAAGTAAKVATLDNADGFSLTKGVTVAIKFSNTNTVADPTLNVNSSGAKSIKRYSTTAPSTSAASSWNAGSVLVLVYDGSYWQMTNWLNTTYSGMTVAEYQAGTSTTTRLITPARLKAAIQHWSTGEANVQSNWNETDSTSDAYILNKPTKLSDFTNDSGFITSYTETDPVFTASPAHGITSNDITNWNAAEPNVNADWNATSGDAQILNKPTILQPLIGTSANITPSQVMTAIDEGRDIVIYHAGDIEGIDTNFTFTSWNRATDADFGGAVLDVVVSDTIASLNNQFYLYELVGGVFQGESLSWMILSTVIAKKTDIPTNVSAFSNDAGYLTSYTETDPTVPAWAKASTKPSYGAAEITYGNSTVSHELGELNSALSLKVDVEPNKGLSTNDYTTTEKNKLAGIASGAEVNVQADWNVTDSSSDAFIKNKPATLTAPYITNQGTYGTTWTYRVWSNNFQEVWFHGSIQFTAASSAINGWYRATKDVSIPISNMSGLTAFADSATIVVSGSYAGRIFTSGGLVKTNGTAFEAQQLGGASMAAATVSGWNVYISGYKRT